MSWRAAALTVMLMCQAKKGKKMSAIKRQRSPSLGTRMGSFLWVSVRVALGISLRARVIY